MICGDRHKHHTLELERNRALISWYEEHARDLPWRGVRDPYQILVSEVMLQQTQVERVVPFFKRFMVSFPTVESLAAASLRDVLEVWNGLGYNVRARRLHESAKTIAQRGWPGRVEDLEALPGVGPYTARAVACFSLDVEVIPIDTNLRRVLSRWHGEPLSPELLQTVAYADSAGAAPPDWTQAVMDLGAMICRPRSPSCDRCPVASWCAGPEVYEPPRSQARFEGSARQLRGAIIRRLVAGAATPATLATETNFPMARVRDALDDLEAEGMVESAGGTYRLPE